MSALGGYSPKEPYSKEGFHMALRKLKRRELIRFTDNDQFTLTEKGRGILLKFEIDDIKLPDFSLQNWDGNWRVLIFDVPEISRAARDILRSKIQELGFYTLQKSVYVTPRPCEKEIIGLARMLKISGGVHVLEVKKLGRNETRIRRFFGVD
jgi:phenylacetic acid degradation operon negative regulatory protein